MKRQHRNVHLIMWLILTPLVSLLALWVLDVRAGGAANQVAPSVTTQMDDG
jgi:hypothetical protein